MVLTVLKNNASALQFYKRMGYGLDETSPAEGEAPYEIRSKPVAAVAGGGAPPPPPNAGSGSGAAAIADMD